MQILSLQSQSLAVSDVDAEHQTPKLFLYLLVTFVLLALIPTIWIELDLWFAGLFTGPLPVIDSANWWWVIALNQHVPYVIQILVLLSFVMWIMASRRPQWFHWRLPLAFIVISCVLGPGLVVNAGFKDTWKRARPMHVQNFGGTQQFTRAGLLTDQCESNCSFVSGHVACGFFFLSLMLVHKHRTKFWATTGVAAGLLIGFSRMSNVAHWVSDVLWAAPVTLVCSWFIWKALCMVYHPKPGWSPHPIPA